VGWGQFPSPCRSLLTTWLSLLFPFGTSYIIFKTTFSDTEIEDFKSYSVYARKLEQQDRACTLATRLFDHSPNSNRPHGLSDHATGARLTVGHVAGPTTTHCCASVTIGRTDGPITSQHRSLCTTWRHAVPLPLTGRTDGLTQGYHTIYTALA